MSAAGSLKKAISHPEKIVYNFGRRGLLNWMNDEMYIKLLYFAAFRKSPHLKNPRTFNEKLQWLKLHDRNPLYIRLVDKYEVKKYIEELCGGGIQYRHMEFGTALMRLILIYYRISSCLSAPMIQAD